MEDEKENLCEQLARQDRALKDLEQEILEWNKAKKEHIEIIVQLQQRGHFLQHKNAQHPDLLKLEIQTLEHRIKACLEDLNVLTRLPRIQLEHPEQNVQDNVGQDLILSMARLVLDKAEAEATNAALKSEIEAIKANATFINDLIANDKCDIDQVVTQSLALRDKLDLVILNKRQVLTSVKKYSRKLSKTSLESLERPLKLLKHYKHMEFDCQDYLKRLILALLEDLILREKMLDNVIQQNWTCAKRIMNLSHEECDPLQIYNPNEEVEKDLLALEHTILV